MEARTGRKRVVVAVLLEHSVKVAISRHRMIEMANGGTSSSGASFPPSHLDNPEAWSEIHRKGDTHTVIHHGRSM